MRDFPRCLLSKRHRLLLLKFFTMFGLAARGAKWFLLLSFALTDVYSSQVEEDNCGCSEKLKELESQMKTVLEVLAIKSQEKPEKGETEQLSQKMKDDDKRPRSDDFGVLEPVVQRLSQTVLDLAGQVRVLQDEQKYKGSVFVRWGHNQCPQNTDLLYSGTMGGPLWSDHGSGSNLLCLPSNPVFDNMKRTDCGPSTIYGSEYEVCPDPHHNMDIVCAVCRSPRLTIMIPATNACPPDWSVEYSGHVMGGYGDYAASTDYVCVDKDPQDRPGGEANMDGQRLYYTVAKCGSLPCPPYQDGVILSCVVCSA